MEKKEISFAEKMLNSYGEQKTSKVEELKSLDRKVKRSAEIFAYTFGIISSLIFGAGMCLAMKVIGGTNLLMVVGIVVGCVGIALCTSNYFIYKAILNSRKKKYADKIVSLSNEILNK